MEYAKKHQLLLRCSAADPRPKNLRTAIVAGFLLSACFAATIVVKCQPKTIPKFTAAVFLTGQLKLDSHPNAKINYTRSTQFNISRANYAKLKLEEMAKFWQLPHLCKQLLTSIDNETIKQIRENVTYEEITPQQYLSASCANIRSRGYLDNPEILSDEEKSFPIAYTILVYDYVWQFERLLRAIYRPQNTYCVHVDLKTNSFVFSAIKQIASCFDNLIVAPKRIPVVWGTVSIVDAELSCMEALRSSNKQWKYLINLTGQEHPLKTAWDVVRVLKSLNGLNSVHGWCPPPAAFSARVFSLRKLNSYWNVTPCVGATNFLITRKFAESLLDDPLSHAVRSLLVDAASPEETLWATLHFNEQLGMPGARDYRKGRPEFNPEMIRLKNWVPIFPCHGKVLRDICIWGVEDLKFIVSRNELFINKLQYDYQHYALDCLEYWHWGKTIQQLQEYWNEQL